MKIINLVAENVKRIKVIEIAPDGTVQIVGGRNAQGKSSLLDAIWLTLGGGPAAKATTRPIRDGETTAKVVLDLGELIVTRTWTETKTVLTVTSADGAKYSSPQSILDTLVGKLAFDPLEFTGMSSRDQVAALLNIVDLDVDLDALAAERKRLYDERTDVGRSEKALGVAPALIADVPEEEVSAVDILAEIRSAQDAARVFDEAERAASRAQTEREAAEDALTAAQDRVARAGQAEAEAVVALLALPIVVDTAPLEARLASVEDTNRAVRANAKTRETVDALAATRALYAALTAKVDALDAQKASALAAAKFPVEGLGFDETGVTYQGVPFSQASTAEQIRVSLAMAMSINPKLRVVHIRNGSLIDADGLAIIAEMAAANDYQVWIERVGDADEGALVIEDGEVAA